MVIQTGNSGIRQAQKSDRPYGFPPAIPSHRESVAVDYILFDFGFHHLQSETRSMEAARLKVHLRPFFRMV